MMAFGIFLIVFSLVFWVNMELDYRNEKASKKKARDHE